MTTTMNEAGIKTGHQPAAFDLVRNAHGVLVLTDARGKAHSGIHAVRAFPISAADEGISLLDAEGHELVWLNSLAELPPATANLIREALAQREFMPVIERVTAVSSFATPSIWDVVTDRGTTQLHLKGEEHIRRMSDKVLMVTDAHGVQFLIRNLHAMDRESRRLLDRFL